MGDVDDYWRAAKQKKSQEDFQRQRRFEAQKIAENRAKRRKRRKENAPRYCPHCKLYLKDEARKVRHMRIIHGPDGSIPIEDNSGPKGSDEGK